MREILVNFDDIPLGGRIRYPGSKDIYVILVKYRESSNDEPMSGTLVKWKGVLGAMTESMVSHLGGTEDCPQEVYFQIDEDNYEDERL